MKLDKMDSGAKLELNFVIRKFLELPGAEKERLYVLTQIGGEDSMDEAGTALLALLVNNREEMAKFAGQPPFKLWAVFPEDAPCKAVLFWQYFKDNLTKRNGDIRIASAT